MRVTQGDTDLRCKSLVVFYEQDDAKSDKGKSLKADSPGPGGEQRIKRLEARGGVMVTQKDQTATGETGVFDMKTNTVTLNGKVVMTQGQNVLRGERLVVDLTSGVSRVESGKNGHDRVQGLFLPSSGAIDLKPGGPRARRPRRTRGGRPIDPPPRAKAPAARCGEESAKVRRRQWRLIGSVCNARRGVARWISSPCFDAGRGPPAVPFGSRPGR